MSKIRLLTLLCFVAEELCTLVITEAYPEDSGIFKCTASNQFGTATCSAMLEVYTGKLIVCLNEWLQINLNECIIYIIQ